MSHLPNNADPRHEPVQGQPAASEGQKLEPMAKPVIGINRPPGPPSDLIGPYLQFVTTENDRRVWKGTALTLHRAGKHRGSPQLTFDHELVAPAIQESVEVLYEDVFGMKALRWNMAFNIPEGPGDEHIKWTLEWQGSGIAKSENSFRIPRWGQKWRGAACSCNGFDETVPDETVKLFGFDGVWKHLNSIAEISPLHLLIYGGDQIYIDLIFQDVPWLKEWITLEWDQKWKREFTPEVSEQVAQYYFYSYTENWERQEIKKALHTVPALMQWDDHDIFDGAGSYPPELRDSPVMLGLVRTAQKFRLLFQHHTTPDLAHSKHGMFGNKGHNSIVQCGPALAILNPDGRTERDAKHVIDDETWDMIFSRLEQVPETTQHLLAVFAVPFSFIRVPAAEALFAFLTARAPWVRRLPGLKGLNSPLSGLPEFYDDLLDEWSHDAHIEERDRALVKLQSFAERHSCRVTMLSGDVHCAGASRFRTNAKLRREKNLTPATDPKLMMQFISSAIVNQSPSPNACIGYHYIRNKWYPTPETEEELVEMFERRPEGGAHVRHRKVMPNRNWLYFETLGEGGGAQSTTEADGVNLTVQADEKAHRHPHLFRHSKKHSHGLLDWSRDHYAFDRTRGYPSTLGPSSAKNGQGANGKPLHEHKHGYFCHHRKSRKLEPELVASEKSDAAASEAPLVPGQPTGLLVRMWLESRKREATKTRQFASYQVCIPDLLVGKRAAQPAAKSAPVVNGTSTALPQQQPALVQQPASVAPTA